MQKLLGYIYGAAAHHVPCAPASNRTTILYIVYAPRHAQCGGGVRRDPPTRCSAAAEQLLFTWSTAHTERVSGVEVPI